MALEGELKSLVEQSQWFRERPAARSIVYDGAQMISKTKPIEHNMQALLSNMCAYGARNWSYEPGSKVNVENTLRGIHKVTDCESLAKMFCAIANALLDCHAVGREIKRDGYRIVTKPGICTFQGKLGDRSLDGRWCFGNHWVAVVAGRCYDPTFKFQGFPISMADKVYLGWYAQETVSNWCFTRRYWKADKLVPGSKDVYMRMVPDVAYTFKRTDPHSGKECLVDIKLPGR